MFDLKGKKALVTGSSQGIGFAIAKCLAEQGAIVFINGTNEEKVKKATAQINGSSSAVCDLSASDCAEKLYELIENTPLDVFEMMTDGCSVFSYHGERVFLVKGETYNIKITYPDDLIRAKGIIREYFN